ncbi:MAG: hypothetical protein H5T76_31445 [Streptomyces sp.]|nr:hypothetical protein [Streptomyces sp.]
MPGAGCRVPGAGCCASRERPHAAFAFILEERVHLRRTGGAELAGRLIEYVPEISELRNA